MVKREQGEGGDNAYRISAGLIHGVLLSLITAGIGLLTYMGIWAIGDAQFKTEVTEQLLTIAARVGKLEGQHIEGIHPIAKERIEYLERRVQRLEANEQRDHRK